MSEAPSQERRELFCWRRIDMVGLELLALRRNAEGVWVESSVICGWQGGYRLDHSWQLTPDWRTLSLGIERWDADGRRSLSLKRDGNRWLVDGEPRPDLDGADEPDLSVTPFCNTLIIRHMLADEGSTLTVDTAYVNGDDLRVSRSRQRYDFKASGCFRYVDLGLAAGFEADLHVDNDGLVRHYEHLFERVEVSS
ncbi:putative glycolipid-binding domain-containing protein [Rhodoligotrophos defluvii]|uniref:putative glycolipid-binding domain-containing protein n=1 Tax=Rhodoligotrophos defluvii TaxID=2561934 RepID=UPI0010C9D184|nr:putative glycolipid-binding domain-containing protein [Rhodoligotrophos defluvii]